MNGAVAGPCATQLPWETAVAYFAGELPPTEELAVEEHAFTCAACSGCLATVAGLVAQVRDAVRAGIIVSALSRASLDQLRARGIRVQEVPITADAPNETTFAPDTEVLVGRVHGDFRGLRRVDLEFHSAYTDPGIERDVPVETTNELIIACSRHCFQDPKGPLETRLKIVDAEDPGRRVVAEYQLRMLGTVTPRPAPPTV